MKRRISVHAQLSLTKDQNFNHLIMDLPFPPSALATKPKMSFQDVEALLTHAVETEKKDNDLARARKLAAQASVPYVPSMLPKQGITVTEQGPHALR